MRPSVREKNQNRSKINSNEKRSYVGINFDLKGGVREGL